MPNAKLKQKLTKTVVEGLAAEPAEYSVWDTTVESFHVRVSPKGTKTLCVIYRTKRGVSRRRSLGRFPTKRIEEARDEARTYISAAKSGGDPFGERDALKAIPTLGKFWDEYWSDHATVKKSARSCESDLQLWKTHLSPRFGRSHVDQVEPATIYRWHAALSEKPGAANRALALLSRLMSLAVVYGHRTTNPCKGIDKYPEMPRDPAVSAEELRAVWLAAKEEERTGDVGAARLVMLTMLTAPRRGEALNARWRDFDLGDGSPRWVVPTEHIKGGKRRRIFITRILSEDVASLMRSWKSSDCDLGDFVFPSTKGRLHPRHDINKPWDRIRKAANRPDLRLHDLRHVFATLAINEGHSLAEIGDTMGHRSAMTTRRYAHIIDRQKNKVATTVSAQILDRRREAQAPS